MLSASCGIQEVIACAVQLLIKREDEKERWGEEAGTDVTAGLECVYKGRRFFFLSDEENCKAGESIFRRFHKGDTAAGRLMADGWFS